MTVRSLATLSVPHRLAVLLTGLALLVAAPPAGAQVDPDPLNGGRTLPPSGELLVLAPGGGGLRQQLFDAQGDLDAAALVSTGQADEADVGTLDEWTPLDAVVGEFDGAGEAEYAMAWEGADGNVRVRVVDSAGGAPGTPGSELVHAHSPGSRPMIRLLAGQFDADPAQELALVHTMDIKQIHWAKYDVGSDLGLVELSSGTISNGSNATGCNPSGAQNLFDAVVADIDADGLDNLVIGRMQEDCLQNQIKNYLYVEAVEFDGSAYHWFTICSNLSLCTNRPSDLSLAAGRFSGPTNPIEIAYHFPTGAWVGADWMPTTVGRVTWNGAGFVEVAAEQTLVDCAGFDCVDRRFEIAAADLDGDGTDELIAARGPRLELYEVTAGGFGIGSKSSSRRAPHATAALATGGHYGLMAGRLAVSDVDRLHSEGLETEIAVLETDGSGQAIRLFRASRAPAGGSWQLTAPSAPGDRIALPVAARDPVVLHAGDLDRDQIYLGLPDSHEVPGVTQPLVILNAPPVHFDVFDGAESYDVANCFPVAGGCDHFATYSQSQGTETLVTGTVRSTWAVAADVEATVGYEGGFFGASVEASLSEEYGENFEKTQAAVSSFQVEIDATAITDGLFYATRADYTVTEYPIYLVSDSPAHGAQDPTPISHVVAVQPQDVSQVFFPMTGPSGLRLGSDHAPNHALSFGPRSQNGTMRREVPILANGSYLGYDLSPTSVYDLAISFDSLTSSERTQGSHQSLGASVEVEAHGAFAGFYGSVSAAVSGSYDGESLQTHSTTIEETTELRVHLGTIDGSLLVDGQPMGSASYTVTPYAYWSHQGALVLDYEVDAGGNGQWWDVVYCGNPFYCTEPDLAFNLPFLHDWEKGYATAPDDLERTRDVAMDPPTAMSGALATLQAVVRNHSLASYPGGATLSFYLEDPRAGGEWIANVPVPALAAREHVVVALPDWEVPYGVVPIGSNPTPRIYAVLDQAGTHPELHEANNVGWAPVDIRSAPACQDGIDNDGDGLVDFAGGDPGCAGSIDESEQSAALVCDDGVDNDSDGLFDFPADPGCRDGLAATESPQCDDGLDNDGDGLIDAADPVCTAPWQNRERKPACGLGFEGALLAGLLRRWRGKRVRGIPPC